MKEVGGKIYCDKCKAEIHFGTGRYTTLEIDVCLSCNGGTLLRYKADPTLIPTEDRPNDDVD